MGISWPWFGKTVWTNEYLINLINHVTELNPLIIAILINKANEVRKNYLHNICFLVNEALQWKLSCHYGFLTDSFQMGY